MGGADLEGSDHLDPWKEGARGPASRKKDTGSWNSESLAQGMLEALTWLCMGRAVLLGAGGESGPRGLLEKSLGKGDLNPPSFHVAFPFFRVNFHL